MSMAGGIMVSMSKSYGHANKELARAMQELRRSNATVPIPSKSKYNRKRDNRDWRRTLAY